MGAGKIAALAVALLASAPAGAQEFQDSIPTTMFYVSVPLGGATLRERMPSYGLAWKGRKQHETVYLDSRTMHHFAGALAGLEAKWLIAGALAVGAGVYVSRKDDDRSDGYNNNQNNQQNSPPPPPCSDPCAKK